MIKLTRTLPGKQNPGITTAWPVEVVVSTDADDDVYIFIHHVSIQQGIPDPFTGVAAYFDLANMPTERPEPCGPNFIPFYRRDRLLKTFYCPRDAEQFWIELQQEVRGLVDDCAVVDQSPGEEEVDFPPPTL